MHDRSGTRVSFGNGSIDEQRSQIYEILNDNTYEYLTTSEQEVAKEILGVTDTLRRANTFVDKYIEERTKRIRAEKFVILLKQKAQKNKQELRRLKKIIIHQETENEANSQINLGLMQDIASLKGDNNKLNNHIQELQGNDEHQHVTDEKDHVIADLEEQLRTASMYKDAQELQLKGCASQIAEILRQKSDSERESQKTIEECNRRAMDQDKEINLLIEQKEELNGRISDLEGDVGSLKQCNERLKEEIASLRKISREKDYLEKELQDCISKLDQLNSERKHMKDTIIELEKEVIEKESYKKKVFELNENLSESKDEKAQFVGVISELRDRISNIEKNSVEKDVEIDKLKNHIDQLNFENRNLMRKIEEDAVDIDRLQENNRQFSDKIVKYSNELALSRQEISHLKSILEDKGRNENSELGLLLKENKTLKILVEEKQRIYTNEIDLLRDENLKIRRELEEFTKSQDINEEYKERIKILEKTNSNLREKIESLKELATTPQHSFDYRDIAEEKAIALEKQIEENEQLVREISALKQSEFELKEEIKDLRRRPEQLKALLRQYSERVDKAEAELGNYRKPLSDQ